MTDQQARPGSKPIEAGASVLVVEDEDPIRDLVVTALRFTGFEVQESASGLDALRRIETGEPELVILDVNLPDMDGFTVCRKARAEGLATPVIFLTARDDPVDLRQVIDNLLANLRVHSPADAPAHVSLIRSDGAAELRVRDEGPGIDPAFLPHIFERFTRQDPARTRATGGSGLGMAIVAALVASMGGTIAAESEAGEGATFIVRLPTTDSVRAEP
jgi:two-component system OmpR family sensor kinase